MGGVSVKLEDNDGQPSYYYYYYYDYASVVPSTHAKTRLRGAAPPQTRDVSRNKETSSIVIGLAPQQFVKAANAKKQPPTTSAASTESLVATLRNAGASLCGSVNVAGWGAPAVDVPSPLLHAVSRVIAAALEDEDQIRLKVKVLHARPPLPDTPVTPATIVDFEIIAESIGSRELLDSAESRLMVLAMGGKALRSFDEALTSSLLSERAPVRDVTRSSFSEPWQIFRAP